MVVLYQILNFLSNKIIPIYIIDGVAPQEKNDIIEYRFNKRNKISQKIEILEEKLKTLGNDDENKDKINSEISKLNKNNISINSYEIDKLLELFNIFNIPYIRAKNEADTLISKLYKNNNINACLSEDMDLLVFGCRKMIKFKSNLVIEYDLDYILKKLNMNNNEFIELCILFGCDYLKPLLRLKPEEIYEKYMNRNNITDMFDNYYNSDTIEKYLVDYKNTKNIFINGDDNEIIDDITFNLTPININKLNNFINNNCLNHITDNINYQISHINELIKNRKFGF